MQWISVRKRNSFLLQNPHHYKAAADAAPDDDDGVDGKNPLHSFITIKKYIIKIIVRKEKRIFIFQQYNKKQTTNEKKGKTQTKT